MPRLQPRSRTIAMLCLPLLVLILTACPGGEPGGGGPRAPTLDFEVIAPPVSGLQVLPGLVEARGNTVVTRAVHAFYSLDRRQTWHRFPRNTSNLHSWHFISDTTGVYVDQNALWYIDLESGAERPIEHPPGSWPATFWHTEKEQWLVSGSRVVVVKETVLGTGHEDGPGALSQLLVLDAAEPAATWTTIDLPVAAPADRTYLASIHLGLGNNVYVVNRFGLYHGVPQPGASWQFHPLAPTGSLMGWANNPVRVTRTGTVYVGQQFVSFDLETFAYREEGSREPWDHQAEDGVLYYRALESRDGGRTWQDTLDPELRARLSENQTLLGTVWRRGNDIYILRDYDGYTTLVAPVDGGRVEVFAPRPEGEEGRAPAVIYALPNGALLARYGTELVSYTPGHANWTWVTGIPREGELSWLPNQNRFVLFKQPNQYGSEANTSWLRFSEDGFTWDNPIEFGPPHGAGRDYAIRDIVSLKDGLLAMVRKSTCGHDFYWSEDLFATWDAPRTGSIPVHGADDPPLNHYFLPAAVTSDDVMFGWARIYNTNYEPCAQTHVSRTVRSNDGALSARDIGRVNILMGLNSRDDLLARSFGEACFNCHMLHLFKRASETWVDIGIPTLRGEPLALQGLGHRMNTGTVMQYTLDAQDRMLLPDMVGVLRSTVPIR